MNWLKRASLVALVSFLLIGGIGTLAYPQGAITLVQLVLGGSLVSGSNPLPVTGTFSTSGAVNVTPTDCSGSITTGGTAQNAFTAGATKHGFTILNFDTTEPLWISFTGTATAATVASYPLQAATATTFAGAGSFATPAGFGMNTALSVVAATTGHKFSCTWW